MKLGLEEAKIVARFENNHIDVLLRISETYHLDCDLIERDTVDAFYDEESFEQAKENVREISRHVAELDHKIYPAQLAQGRLRVSKSCVGAIVTRAAQIRAYKLVTEIVEKLVENGINLQTETPVTNISRGDGGKWTVETTRGLIIASNVVHATNGYIQNLLPKFSAIAPKRGYMSAQIPPKNLSQTPLDHTYCFIYEGGRYDYLVQQTVECGSKLMVGASTIRAPDPNISNDGDIPETLKHYLRQLLPKVLQWEDEEDPENRLYMAWSGIMGISKDDRPWVGALPESVGGGPGQWICAGYTGEGIGF